METLAVADERAERLLQLWSRLSLQHVSLGVGCGCGIGGVSVSLADFERDIADYLWAESERLGEAALPALSIVLVGLAPVLLVMRALDGGRGRHLQSGGPPA